MNENERLIKKRAEDNIKLIYKPVQNFYSSNEMVRLKYDFRELLSVATLSLYKASEKFDETKGYKFSTYAIPLIKFSLIEFTRKDKWYFNRVNVNGVDKFEPVERISTSACLRDARISGDNDLTVIDTLEDKSEIYKDTDDKVIVEYLLSTCVDREKEILKAYFFDQKSQSQLAKEFKTSQSFISLVIKRNLKRFKEILGNEALSYETI